MRAIRVHGSRYGYPQAPKEDIEVTLLTEDMTEVLHTELVPYSLFKRTKARWTHLPFKEQIEVPARYSRSFRNTGETLRRRNLRLEQRPLHESTCLVFGQSSEDYEGHPARTLQAERFKLRNRF